MRVCNGKQGIPTMTETKQRFTLEAKRNATRIASTSFGGEFA